MIHLVLIIKALLELSIVLLACFTIALVGVFITERIEIYYRNCKAKKRIQQLEKEHEEFIQRQHKMELELIVEEQRQKLREEERKKYPLFYWKKGIV